MFVASVMFSFGLSSLAWAVGSDTSHVVLLFLIWFASAHLRFPKSQSARPSSLQMESLSRIVMCMWAPALFLWWAPAAICLPLELDGHSALSIAIWQQDLYPMWWILLTLSPIHYATSYLGERIHHSTYVALMVCGVIMAVTG